ncbi:MAG: DUF4352 domain-containing protein [Chloroflexi bacterium]|nr:DUF4352 domain-containing protein [Chloroflexota bacterium]MCL5275168.1 DUF4352 domain-containing protein [Chloroflexota bacterium]
MASNDMRINSRLVFPVSALAVLALGCGLISIKTPGAAAPQSTQPAAGTSQAAATAAPQATSAGQTGAEPGTAASTFLGDVVEQDGMLLSVAKVVDPATPIAEYKVSAGHRLIALDMTAGNVSIAKFRENPLQSAVVDQAGRTYKPVFAALDSEITIAELNPGEKIRGWVAYLAPNNVKIVALRYAPSIKSDQYFEIGLLPAPAGHAPTQAQTARPQVNLPRLGAPVEVNGYSMTALSLADPAKPGILYQPQNGMRLVSVDVAMSNVSGDTMPCNPDFFLLVDTNGYVYAPELGGVDGQLDAVDLNKGEKAQGLVAFVIPNDARVESLRFAPFLRLDFLLQTGLTN